MGLLSKAKSNERDYIEFLQFIFDLSEQEQETVSDIAIYLNKINFLSKINCYTCNKQWDFVAYGNNQGIRYLEKILSIIPTTINSFFIYQQEKHLQLDLEQELVKIDRFSETQHFGMIFLKKSELKAIDDFKGYLNFLDEPKQAHQITTLSKQGADLEQQLQANQGAGVNQHSHSNEALQALHDVINEFWQDPNNPPKQEFIKAHIAGNYPSIEPSKALWIDKIIRHKDK